MEIFHVPITPIPKFRMLVTLLSKRKDQIFSDIISLVNYVLDLDLKVNTNINVSYQIHVIGETFQYF